MQFFWKHMLDFGYLCYFHLSNVKVLKASNFFLIFFPPSKPNLTLGQATHPENLALSLTKPCKKCSFTIWFIIQQSKHSMFGKINISRASIVSYSSNGNEEELQNETPEEKWGGGEKKG